MCKRCIVRMVLSNKWKNYIFKVLCAVLLFYGAFIWSNYRTMTNKEANNMNERVLFSDIKQTTKRQYNERRTLEKKLPHAFTFNDNKWKLTNLCKPYKFFVNKTDFPLIEYTSKAGTIKIFTHSTKNDGISSIINKTGAFEVKIINRVLNELEKHTQLNLIDIGTNIGQYCLATALIGRDSIAIDAAESNIRHVCASAHFLNFGQKITLIHNILSDTHDKHDFRYSKGGDYGSIHVDSDGIWDKMNQKYEGYFNPSTVQYNSVMLDDLLELPQMHRFKKVFIKMDVEGHEHRVLLGANEFFARIDIHGIIMEWAWHVRRPSSEIIKSFMAKWNFKPFKMYKDTETALNPERSDSWPHDVLWLPK